LCPTEQLTRQMIEVGHQRRRFSPNRDVGFAPDRRPLRSAAGRVMAIDGAVNVDIIRRWWEDCGRAELFGIGWQTFVTGGAVVMVAIGSGLIWLSFRSPLLKIRKP